jgi:hypothetical protein
MAGGIAWISKFGMGSLFSSDLNASIPLFSGGEWGCDSVLVSLRGGLKRHAYEIHAHEVHTHEVYAYKVDVHEVHAYEIDAHEMHACQGCEIRKNTIKSRFGIISSTGTGLINLPGAKTCQA